MQHYQRLCNSFPRKASTTESSDVSPKSRHTIIARDGRSGRVPFGVGHDRGMLSSHRIHFKNVPCEKTGCFVPPDLQSERLEQIPIDKEIPIIKPLQCSGFPPKRGLSGFRRSVAGLLSYSNRRQTPKIPNLLVQEQAIQLDMPSIRIGNSSSIFRPCDELGCRVVPQRGDSDSRLSRRFSSCPPESDLPPISSRSRSSASQVSGLDGERDEIATVSSPVYSVPGNFLEHRNQSNFPPREKGGGYPRSPKEIYSSENMVTERCSISNGQSWICEFCNPTGTASPSTDPVGKSTALSAVSSSPGPNSPECSGDVTLVDGKHSKRCSSAFPRKSCIPVVGCVGFGVGSSSGGPILSRPLVSSPDEVAYQCKRTLCSSFCNLAESSASTEPHCHSAIRQQDCCLLHQKTGGTSVSCSPFGNDEAIFNHIPLEHSYSSVLHSGEAQHNRGQPLPPDQCPGMAPEVISDIKHLQEMGSARDRPLCFPDIEGSSKICISEPKRHPSGVSGRFFQNLELSTGVAFPASSPDTPSVTSPEQCQGFLPISCPPLGQSVLESRPESQGSSSPLDLLGVEASHGGFDNRSATGTSRRIDVGNLDLTGWSPQISDWSLRDKSLLSSAWRSSTISSYRKPWSRWTTWAKSRGVNVCFPTPQSLAQFLAHLFYDVKLAPASIMVHKSVVATMSNPDNSSALSSHPIVTKMIKGITFSSKSSSSSESRVIWNVSDLQEWISANPPRLSSFFDVSRHLALLFLLSSGRRLHDLTLLHIDAQHFQRSDDSITFWPAFGSKTDSASFRQSGWQYSISVSPPAIEWDLSYWLDVFLHLRKVRCGSLNLSSLFISSRGPVRPASRAIIAGWIKTALKSAGIPFSPGSLRSAVNTSLARDNFSLDMIMDRANWRSANTFLRHYYRPLQTQHSTQGVSNIPFRAIH